MIINKLYTILLEFIVLPIADKLTNQSIIKILSDLNNYDKYSSDKLELIQKEKLKKILLYSSEFSTYYEELNIIADKNPIIWLKKFPILTKSLIRDKTDEILIENKENLHKQSSSGSSGYQTTVYMSIIEMSFSRAQQLHWWKWAGYKFGTPILQTGITPNRGLIKKIKDVLLRTTYISAFSHKEDEIVKILKQIQAKPSHILAGYASSLYVIAQIAEKNNIQIEFISAISWGDKLFSHYKELIEKQFKCKIYETYGSSEGFMIASQKDLQQMYINTPNIYLELLDDNGNEVKDGEIGHVVVTNLNMKSMPLIRYKLGDLAIKMPKSQYPKNNELNYPILQKVIGRDTDIVKTLSGKYMIVHSFTGIFEHYQEIMQYQIIQNSLAGINILYIPSKEFNIKIISEITKKILNEIQEKFTIKFIKVKQIGNSPSGKPQIIVSNLEN